MDEQPQRSRERNREEHDKDDLVAPRTGVPAHSGRQTAASRADTHTANSGARTGSSWSCSAFQSLPPEVDEDNLGRTASDILQRPGKAIDEGAAGAESIDAGEASREDATSGERSSDNQPNVIFSAPTTLIANRPAYIAEPPASPAGQCPPPDCDASGRIQLDVL